jgi:hypothetical protein
MYIIIDAYGMIGVDKKGKKTSENKIDIVIPRSIGKKKKKKTTENIYILRGRTSNSSVILILARYNGGYREQNS